MTQPLTRKMDAMIGRFGEKKTHTSSFLRQSQWVLGLATFMPDWNLKTASTKAPGFQSGKLEVLGWGFRTQKNTYDNSLAN